MLIRECIETVDALKPNTYQKEDKVRWLSNLDGRIVEEVIKKHVMDEPIEFQPYDVENLETELLVKFPHDELYEAYLKMKIDEENGETARYNNSAAMFNALYEEFAKAYHRTHKPIPASRFKIL